MYVLLIAKAFNPPEKGGLKAYSGQVAMAWRRVGDEETDVTARVERNCGTAFLSSILARGGQAEVFQRMLSACWRLRRRRFDMVQATARRVALPILLLRRKTPRVISIHGREVLLVPASLRSLLRYARILPLHAETSRGAARGVNICA